MKSFGFSIIRWQSRGVCGLAEAFDDRWAEGDIGHEMASITSTWMRAAAALGSRNLVCQVGKIRREDGGKSSTIGFLP